MDVEGSLLSPSGVVGIQFPLQRYSIREVWRRNGFRMTNTRGYVVAPRPASVDRMGETAWTTKSHASHKYDCHALIVCLFLSSMTSVFSSFTLLFSRTNFSYGNYHLK